MSWTTTEGMKPEDFVAEDKVKNDIVKDLKEGDDLLSQVPDEEVERLLTLDINNPEDWEEMMEYL